MATVDLGWFQFDGAGATGDYFGGSESHIRIRLSETYDISTNKSTVKITDIQFKFNGHYGGSVSALPYFYVYVNNDIVATLNGESYQVIYNPSGGNGWVSFSNVSGFSASPEITHNSDGSASISLKVVRLNSDWVNATVWLNEGWSIGSCYVTSTSGGTKTVTLTTIPRASSITSASNVTLGNACSVTWTPLSTSFRYKLSFSLGSWSYTTGVINPGTTSSYTYTGYTIPVTVANQLPNSTTGTMTVTLYTYSDTGGTSQVGSSSSKTFTVTVQASAVPGAPSITASLVNSNSTVSGWNVAVQGYTAVRLSGSASGSYGSTISSYVISGGYSITRTGTTLDYTGGKINSSGSVSFSVVAVDSRGRRSSATTVSVTFYAYSAPSISSFTAYRSSSNATTVLAKGVWSYSSVNNKNSASGRVYYKLSNGSSWIANAAITNNTQQTLSWTFSATSSYDVKLIVTDSLGSTAEYTVKISTEAVTFHLAENGTGAAFGKYAEKGGALEVAWDIMPYGSFIPVEISDCNAAFDAAAANSFTIGFILSAASNAPFTGNGVLLTHRTGSGTWGSQLAFGDAGLYYRAKRSGTWTAWTTITTG